MLAIKEEELNMVNGGTLFGDIPEAKFHVGDRVRVTTEPPTKVGVVTNVSYNYGESSWYYGVRMDDNEVFLAPEEVIDYPLN